MSASRDDGASSAGKRQKVEGSGLLSIRVRGPSKTALLEDVDPQGGIIRFLERVKEAAGVEEYAIVLRTGMPPTKIEIDLGKPVAALNLEDKSTIIVAPGPGGVTIAPYDSGWRAQAQAQRRLEAAAAAGDEAAITTLAASAAAAAKASAEAAANTTWKKQFIAVLGEGANCPLKSITSDKNAGYYCWGDVGPMLESYDKDSERVTKLAKPGLVTVKLSNTWGKLRAAAGAGSCILGATKPSGYCVVLSTSDLRDFDDEDFDMESFKERLSQDDYNEGYDPDKDSPPAPSQPREYSI
jgi:hypothetical protein